MGGERGKIRRRTASSPLGRGANSIPQRLVYPGGGDGGGELLQYDSGPAGEPEGRGRRAPGGAWGQRSEEARDELTRPLRVESGRTSSPGGGPSQWQPDHISDLSPSSISNLREGVEDVECRAL